MTLIYKKKELIKKNYYNVFDIYLFCLVKRKKREKT